jgi:hypothetical protein
LILLLIVVGLIIEFFWWIVGIVAVFALLHLMGWLIRENRKRRDAIARCHAAVAARADEQHRWVLEGDDRGIFGSDGAPLMHYIEQGRTQDMSTTTQPLTWRIGPFGTRFAR